MTKQDSIKLFESNKIRVSWDTESEKWYFSIIDIIESLTGSNNPRRYWSDLKRKLKKEGFNQLYEIIVQLKLLAPDGKNRQTDCCDTEGILRVIQSIPSPKAEPFKRWLAKVGYERIQETEDPEISFERAIETYQKKGYSTNWINQRIKSIEVRKELTDEWNTRGEKKGIEYAILTDDITKAWSGLSVKKYNLKHLKKIAKLQMKAEQLQVIPEKKLKKKPEKASLLPKTQLLYKKTKNSKNNKGIKYK